MENMILCLNAVFPLFIIIALGFLARRLGMIDRASVLKLNKIVFRFFMPFMIFSNIYGADLKTSINPRLVGFAAVCVVAVFLLSTAVTVLFTKDRSKQGVIIQALFRSNYVIIGLPIAASLVPGSDLSSVAVVVVVVVAIYNVLAVICLSVFSGKKARLWDTCLNILKNPLLIASAIGLLFPLLGIKLPSAIDSAVNSLSDAASPIALFVLGAFIEFGSFGRFKRELVFVCSFRLLLIPALFLSISYLCGFRGLEFAALLGAFASSTAVTSFTMAQQMGGDADLAGAIVIMTSSLCPFTLLLWCMAAKTMGIL